MSLILSEKEKREKQDERKNNGLPSNKEKLREKQKGEETTGYFSS